MVSPSVFRSKYIQALQLGGVLSSGWPDGVHQGLLQLPMVEMLHIPYREDSNIERLARDDLGDHIGRDRESIKDQRLHAL